MEPPYTNRKVGARHRFQRFALGERIKYFVCASANRSGNDTRGFINRSLYIWSWHPRTDFGTA
jgi:hypothetical protein